MPGERSRTAVSPAMPSGTASAMTSTLLAYTAHEQRQLVAGIVSILVGVLIFVFPRFLNYIVAAYLVVVGIVLVLAATS